MMKDNKIKCAFFTIPEYEKEQSWLRKQHNEGWELTRVTLLGIYYFYTLKRTFRMLKTTCFFEKSYVVQ